MENPKSQNLKRALGHQYHVFREPPMWAPVEAYGHQPSSGDRRSTQLLGIAIGIMDNRWMEVHWKWSSI